MPSERNLHYRKTIARDKCFTDETESLTVWCGTSLPLLAEIVYRQSGICNSANEEIKNNYSICVSSDPFSSGFNIESEKTKLLYNE